MKPKKQIQYIRNNEYTDFMRDENGKLYLIGRLLPEDKQNKIACYLNCTRAFLNDESIINYSPSDCSPNTSPEESATMWDVISVLHHLPETQSYRIIQVQISRIVLFHLAEYGIGRDQLNCIRFNKDKLDWLFFGNSHRGQPRYNQAFGFSYRDLEVIRELTRISFSEMFTGHK